MQFLINKILVFRETYKFLEEGMKVAELKLKLYVATIHAEEWYRGQVIEIVSPTRCKVVSEYVSRWILSNYVFLLVQILLVDCGTNLEKEMKDLCYLVDDPVYKAEHFAVLASLHNVEPPSNLLAWPIHSIKRFSELAFSVDVLAEYSSEGSGVRTDLLFLVQFNILLSYNL